MNKLPIETKLIVYLSRWPEGLSTSRMQAWIASCRKDDGYTMREYDSALISLRDSGRVACVNKIWYLKDIPTAFRELGNDRLNRRKHRRKAANVA
jgi:hypothetical protein